MGSSIQNIFNSQGFQETHLIIALALKSKILSSKSGPDINEVAGRNTLSKITVAQFLSIYRPVKLKAIYTGI